MLLDWLLCSCMRLLCNLEDCQSAIIKWTSSKNPSLSPYLKNVFTIREFPHFLLSTPGTWLTETVKDFRKQKVTIKPQDHLIAFVIKGHFHLSSYSPFRDNTKSKHHSTYCWNVFWREFVGCVWDQETGFTHSSISHYYTLYRLHFGVSPETIYMPSKLHVKSCIQASFYNFPTKISSPLWNCTRRCRFCMNHGHPLYLYKW